jgi:hypothetical protein
MWPPSPWPSRAARSEPTSSSTVRTSSIHSSGVGIAPSGTGSDRPLPRLSKKTRRPKDASRSRNFATVGSSRMISRLVAQSGMKTMSGGPSPDTWYATLCPSLFFA